MTITKGEVKPEFLKHVEGGEGKGCGGQRVVISFWRGEETLRRAKGRNPPPLETTHSNTQ